jgi:hypothetical protein
MRNQIENPKIYATVVLLFIIALVVHGFTGAAAPAVIGSFSLGITAHDVPPSSVVAHSPTIPPDPWEEEGVRLAHSPTIPPDPWEEEGVRLAHSPTIPPDPWEEEGVRLAHSPTIPPDPWEEGASNS